MKCEKTLKDIGGAPYDAAKDGCPVHWAAELAARVQAESCGKALYCRSGFQQIGLILEALRSGQTKDEDLDLLKELTGQVSRLSDCAMSRDAAKLIADTLAEQADVFQQHARRKRCPSLKCAPLAQFYIDPAACTGCGKCLERCPSGAIAGGEGMIHVISTARCTHCAACEGVCAAVKRCDPHGVAPKLPAQPCPVGSFAAAAAAPGRGGLRGGLRGRRG